MSDTNFGFRLIEALQPVRGFVLAQAIYHLFATGMHERLSEGPATVDEIAADLSLDAERVEGFVRFLANEDVVAVSGREVSLTPRGHALADFRPWYELLVGGYAETFQQITQVLKGNGYATRNGELVGVGSCGISRFDALPLVRRLLAEAEEEVSHIIDLGCGDGQFLQRLTEEHPRARGVGVDPYAPAAQTNGRVTFQRASATEYVRELGDAGGASGGLFLAAFLLQEIIEQEGRDAVVDLVRRALDHARYFAVVEVEHRPDDPAVMQHGLGLAYYNPYYLIHVLTEQRLETRRFWRDLFDEAGAAVVADYTVDSSVDATGLEFGCLLTRR